MFDTIPVIIEAMCAGEMVVILDDADRENEGDLIMAAQAVTPAHINFMITHGRGLVCLPMTADKAAQLDLPLMARDNGSPFHTNFTVSIEAAAGVSTGISASDRATTIARAAHPDAKATDLVKPGHIFPLIAQDGGVLSRRGHTEASVDLARLAGFAPMGVLCEILNPDGEMARRDDLISFSKQHGLKLGTIEDLVQYQRERGTSDVNHQRPTQTPQRSDSHSHIPL